MPLLNKLGKAGLKLILLVVMLTSTLYLLLLLLNLQDEAPSAAALSLQQQLADAQPGVEQTVANNGYLYLSQHSSNNAYPLAKSLQALFNQCVNDECLALLQQQADLPERVSQHQALSDFYRQLHNLPYWYLPIPEDAAATLPPISPLLNGQKILLLQAWLAAQQQDAVTVQQLLQQDLQFWRSMLLKNNLLLFKLSATAAIEHHFRFAGVIQQQLAASNTEFLPPAAWLNAYSTEEVSLQLVIAGEWAYGNHIIDSLVMNAVTDANLSVSEQLEWYLLTPLLQVQATSNQRASQLIAYAANAPQPKTPWYSWWYNPVGKILNSVAQPDYAHYQQRLGALEHLRQQAIDGP